MMFILATTLTIPIMAIRQEPRHLQESVLEMFQDDFYTPEEYEKMIADYRADWKKYGVEVEVFDNVSQLLAVEKLPWKDAFDKKVSFNSSEDRPRCEEGDCQEVKLEEVVPFLKGHPFLYHGGAIKSEWFANGIDFSKTKDRITGPVFFTTHNIFHALIYAWKAMFDWGEMVIDPNKPGLQFSGFYRPVMEFEIQKMDQCRGLVPDIAFLQKGADQGTDVGKWMETQCGGHKCSFLAVNWNKDGKEGSGLLPYEIRLLPGSVESCGVKLKKIVLLFSSLTDKFFDHEDPRYNEAMRIFHELFKKRNE